MNPRGLTPYTLNVDGVKYTYFGDGRVASRKWRREGGIKTDYGYNTFGDLESITYPDNTPDVVFSTFDRLGRPGTVTEDGQATTLTYDALTGEVSTAYAASHGILPGLSVATKSPNFGRPGGYTLSKGSAVLADVSYGYDSAGRFGGITSGNDQIGYQYYPGTSILRETTHTQAGSVPRVETRHVDLARRLTGIITTVPNGPGRRTAASAGYLINNRGLRDKLTHEDGTSWSYTYNDRGEVTSGKKHLANGSLAAGHNFGYQYDGIGNRREAKSGGNSSGIGQRTVTYTPNALNQYSSITTPGSFDVLVRSTNAVGVAVNGTPVSVASQGTFHRAQGTATNTAGAWAALTITSPVGQNSITGRRWLPPATFTPTQTNGELDNYDQDGNLLNDGRWANTWDAENRLITQTTTPLAAAAGVPRIKVENTYDWQSRRIGKKVSSSTNGTTWTVVSDERFVYERWNQLAVFAASGNTLSVKESNLWGLDLSGTLQGAGGVSGLLSVTINNQPSTINLFPAYDGNGNIIAWTDSNGVTKQRIDYDPFGNVVTREGDSGFVAPAWGFSTKYQDEETGLLYFGFRFYDSATGRWLSKDPIGEKGGINLYGFVANKSINCYDILGLNIERQVQKGDLNISYDVIKNANNPHNIEGFANSSVSDDLEGMTGLFVGGIDTWGQTSVPFGWASGTWGQWGSGVISWVEVQGAPWDWPHCNTVVNVRSKDAGAIFVNASLRKDSCCRKYVFYYSVSLKGDTTGDSAGVSSEMKTLGGSLSLRLSGRKNSKWLSRDEKRKGFMSKEICICPGESVLVASSKQSVTTNLAFANAQSWTAIDITDVKDMGECTK